MEGDRPYGRRHGKSEGVREKEGLNRTLGSETHEEIIWVAGVARKGGTLV